MGRKLSLDLKIRYFTNGKTAKFQFHLSLDFYNSFNAISCIPEIQSPNLVILTPMNLTNMGQAPKIKICAYVQ